MDDCHGPHTASPLPPWPYFGVVKTLPTNRQEDKKTQQREPEDPLIGGTTGSPRGAVQ